MTSGGEPLRLNLGAGQSRIEGFINIDVSPRADLQLELGKTPLPFPDSSVGEIFSYHTVEHVDNYLSLMNELYRVLVPGGRLYIGLPYVSLTEHHLVNPYHLHNFNEFSFDFFDPQKMKGSAAEENPVHFLKIFHRYHYIGAFHYYPKPLRTWCRRHLFNVVDKIDFGLIAVKDSHAQERQRLPEKQEMAARFDQLLESREFYDPQVKAGILRSNKARPSAPE